MQAGCVVVLGSALVGICIVNVMLYIIAHKMEAAKLRVIYFGSYKYKHPRHRITIKGLSKNGAEVIECNSDKKGIFPRLIHLAWLGLKNFRRGDLILVSGGGQAYVPLAKILGILFKRPVFLDAFISYFHVHVVDAKDTPSKSFKAFYYYLLDYFACRLADFVFLDTKAHIEYFIRTFKLPKEKFGVLPTGSDEDIFSRGDSGDKNRLKIISVSSYYPLHGIKYVIEAAKILENEPVDFLFYGDGPQKEEMVGFAKKTGIKNVKFFGFVDEHEWPAILKEADICLGQFGNTEQARMVVPFKVWDSAALGKPIVTQSSEVLDKIFKDKKDILFVDGANSASIVEAIKYILGNRSEIKNIGDSARSIFLQKYTTAQIGENLLLEINRQLGGEPAQYNLAFFVSHPIHYVIGLMRAIKDIPTINLDVYFGSDFSIRESIDPTFGKVVRWYSPEILNGLKYKVLKNRSPHKQVGKFFSLVNLEIFKHLFSKKYNAIFINGWNYFSNWLTIFAAIISRTPYILRGESPDNQEYSKSFLTRAAKMLILTPIFWMASAIVYIGEENKKFYKRYFVPSKKMFFSPYSVDNKDFENIEKELVGKRQQLRDELGLPQDKKIILFLGKLIDKKNPGDLLRAFLLFQREDSALVFVGDGPLRDNLESIAKNKNVYFAGFKSQSEISKYYAASDIFVLPSGIGETWGLVVNEAMCFGLPVIVSNLVGCGPDLVRNGVNGYIFPANDIQQLKERLELLLDDDKLRHSAGEASKKIILGYNFDKAAEGVAAALKYINKNR